MYYTISIFFFITIYNLKCICTYFLNHSCTFSLQVFWCIYMPVRSLEIHDIITEKWPPCLVAGLTFKAALILWLCVLQKRSLTMNPYWLITQFCGTAFKNNLWLAYCVLLRQHQTADKCQRLIGEESLTCRELKTCMYFTGVGGKQTTANTRENNGLTFIWLPGL